MMALAFKMVVLFVLDIRVNQRCALHIGLLPIFY